MLRRVPVVLVGLMFMMAACVAPAAPELTGRLVFEREVDGNSDIYVMDVESGQMIRLTDDPAWDGTPTWSPDGTRIAFASERLGAPVIFVMDADGSNVSALSDARWPSLMPAWAPDGNRIAYATTRFYEDPAQGGSLQVEAGLEIWVVNVDGTSLTRVTGNYEDQALYPTWSPDGERLAYMQIGETVRILSKPPLTTATASVVTNGLEGRHWTPAWSPDGRQIAVMIEIDGANDIWLVPPEGGEAVALTSSETNDGEPTWAPDGRHMAFISDRDGSLAIYVMDSDGQNVRKLTDDNFKYAHPHWGVAGS